MKNEEVDRGCVYTSLESGMRKVPVMGVKEGRKE
jgi:hypothetical protein